MWFDIGNMIINSIYPNYKRQVSFKGNTTTQKSVLSYRYHQKRTSEQKEAIRAACGAVIGTLIPLLFFVKKQNSKITNIHYGLKEIATVSAGSIIGGILGGRIDNNKYDQIQKVKEGVFQFSNAVIPPALVVGINRLTKNWKFANKAIPKIISTIAGLGVGMILSAKVSNLICDPKDKEHDRKLTIKDSIANIDDAVGVLAMSNFPCLHKVAGVMLPIVYAFCGFRAGESN